MIDELNKLMWNVKETSEKWYSNPTDKNYKEYLRAREAYVSSIVETQKNLDRNSKVGERE